MTQSAWPFDSIDTTETQFSQWARNIGEGVKGSSAGTELKPYGDSTGMFVKVPAGQALVRGHYYSNDAIVSLAVTSAHPTLARIDSVVLTLDPSLNTCVLAVVAGAPNASPVAPTLTQTDAAVYQIRLGNIAVGAAVSTIAAGNVTDTRTFLGNLSTGGGTLTGALTGTALTLSGLATLNGGATTTAVNKVAITAPASNATLTIANTKTLAVNNSITLAGTDASTLNVATGGTLNSGAFANIQAGVGSITTTTTGGNVTISFPVTYTSAPIVVVTYNTASALTNELGPLVVSSTATSNFVAAAKKVSGSSSSLNFNWIAFGN